MASQYALASKDDLWRLQTEMKNVYATQAEHADRLMRLEQRQDGDSRLRSTWGNQSPFPNVLNGTPQQDAGYNPAAEAFKNFDADQSNLMGSLHLDTEDEPRRGASRANSVRFDESALHGHFSAGSRSSTDFLPMRTGSGFGSHAMTERSSSHKSEGRQSSTHSARASSFGLESRPLSATVPPFVPLGPPPGLFILGPVPSIIRCWLATDFSNSTLLYAAVCTGSYKSTLGIDLISRLGYQDQIAVDNDGQRIIKLPVYLPEATIQTASSRSSSPAPTLPTLTISFSVQDSPGDEETIQILIGCDVLRSRNADIHFSLDRLTLFDDERNKLSVPLVRPENATLFQNLQTRTVTDVSLTSSVSEDSTKANDVATKAHPGAKEADEDLTPRKQEQSIDDPVPGSSSNTAPAPATSSPSVIGEGRKIAKDSSVTEASRTRKSTNDVRESETLANGNSPDTPTRTDSSNIWGSWRRDSVLGNRSDAPSSNTTSSSGYQRPGRGRGMKVLRPSRVTTSRSASSQQPVGFDAAPSRVGDRSKSAASDENHSPASATDRKSAIDSDKGPLHSITNKPRSSNPIGGASAFGWLNSSNNPD